MTPTHEFLHPWAFLLLLLLIPLGYWRFAPRFKGRRDATFLFSGTHLLAKQRRTLRTILAPLPDLIKLAVAVLAIFALARPQTLTPERSRVESIDIYLALDMSGSMRAIDLTPEQLEAKITRDEAPENRFQVAVQTLKSFIDSRPHDRVGMVVFARDAFLQFPLTLDRTTIQGMLDTLQLEDINPGGTAIGNALGRAVAGLKDSEAKTKIIVLITDGDRQGGNISPKQATEIAKELGIHIYPILVGKEGTVIVPSGRDLFSGRIQYQQVEFPVNPELLEEIAKTTGGTFTRASDGEALLKDLHSILDSYEKTAIEDSVNVNRSEQVGPILLWAIALLSLQFLLDFTLFRKFS